MDDRIVHHLYLHAIFSTKGQEPVLEDGVREDLGHVVGGALQDLKCTAVQLYIGADHIHILYKQSDDVSVDAGINAVKRESEAWLRGNHEAFRDFKWQESYAAFSVGGMDVGDVAQQLRDQGEYHLIHSFEDEFIRILTEGEIEFDENEIWD